MEELIILNDIKTDICAEDLIRTGRASKATAQRAYGKYFDTVNAVARPKAMIRCCDVTPVGEDYVRIYDTVIQNRHVSEELAGTSEVYVYVVTSGNEIAECEELSGSVKDIFSFLAMLKGMNVVRRTIKENFGEGELQSLRPGAEGNDWDVTDVKEICEMIGDISQIGVSFTDKGYMTPWNSVAGILYKKQGN